MLFFREGLKKWYFFMTFDIKGGGVVSIANMLFAATKTGVLLVQKHCFKLC